MRIGIDTRELGGRPTGVGRYLAGLLREWAVDERARRHDFVLYAAEPPAMGIDERFSTQLIRGAGGTWWQQVQLPKVAAADRLDVFFAPAYTVPLRLCVPTVVAIHDVSYLAHPEWFRRREGLRRRWLTRASARRARTIVTISEFSKREILDRLHVRESRVHVIPIGRTFPHEDIERAIGISVLAHRARWHRYAGDDHLRALYLGARAFAFLSEYEGLGTTPLEALACGVPPVVLDTDVARESLGDAAVFVPFNSDVPAIARALETALFDQTVRTRVLAAAPAALTKYQWPRTAAETMAVLEMACNP